jgi:hypothetical protein
MRVYKIQIGYTDKWQTVPETDFIKIDEGWLHYRFAGDEWIARPGGWKVEEL